MKMFTNSMMVLALAVGLAIVGSVPSSATMINVLNPGFEADSAADGAFGSPPSNWSTPNSSAGFGDPTAAMIPGQGGDINNMAYLNPDGRLSQDLIYLDLSPVLIAPNQIFTITADFGRRSDVTVGDSPVEVAIMETSGFTTVASATYQVASQGLGTITTQTFALNTGASPLGAGSQARLQFHLLDIPPGAPSPDQALFDNVLATVTLIPEPSTLALLTVGLLLARRFSRKSGRRG